MLVFGTSVLQAQSIEELMDNGKSYHEICIQMNKKFEGKSFIKNTKNYSREYKQFKRWAYFWKHRLLPNGNFPTATDLIKPWQFEQDHFSRDFLKQSACETGNWSYLGPDNLPTSDVAFYPGLGRINTIAIHPNNHNVLFAGGASSGIWKSTNKGNTWTPMTDQLPNIGISHIVIDPNNPNTLYAATGDADGNRSPFSTGLLKSTDLGDTWTIVGLNQNYSDEFSIKKILIPKNQSNTLYLTSSAGIQKSTNGGSSFTIVNSIPSHAIVQVSNSNTFYVGTTNGKILKTVDGGATWSEITPSNVSFNGKMEIAVTVHHTDFIIAMDKDGTIAKSNDAGTTWTALSSPPNYDTQGGYNMTLAVSPNNKDLIILGGINGWRSTNGGTTWEKYLDGYWTNGEPYFYVHSDHHDMVFVPGGSDSLYVAHDGGVHYGDITQNTPFVDITQGLFTTQYYGIGALKTSLGTIIGGAQDNDGVYINGNSTKGLLPGSDGYDGMINFTNPDIAYISTTGGNFSKTTDGWNTESAMTIPGYSSNWEVPMAMHPTNASTLFVGGNKLMKSTDDGNTWTELNSTQGILELDIAPSSGDHITFSNDNNLYRSTNGGQNWTTITSGIPLNNTLISGIATHSTNPNTIYVSLSGFNATNKVFKTTDGGQNWTNITHNLSNIPVNDIAYATGTNNHVYIATDLGVYILDESQNSWTQFNNGLPYTQVFELDFHYSSQTIYAATYGRGVWKSCMKTNAVGLTESDQDIMSLYPTVTSGQFHLSLSQNIHLSQANLVVFNSIGGVVYNKPLNAYEVDINLNNTSNGMYFVSLILNQKTITQKIIIDGKN